MTPLGEQRRSPPLPSPEKAGKQFRFKSPLEYHLHTNFSAMSHEIILFRNLSVELGLLELIIFLRTSTRFPLAANPNSPFVHDFHSPHSFDRLHLQCYSPGIDGRGLRRRISFRGV
jgi:hypothetical protein